MWKSGGVRFKDSLSKKSARPHLNQPVKSGDVPTTGVGEDAGKKEPSYTVGGNVD
jgi:hypothetical protein